MHHLIMRFERAARESILLVYLSALFIATATYFAGRSLGMGANFLWYVALAEALAVEVHSFLSQRQTRVYHQELHSEAVQQAPYKVRDAIEKRYLLHLRITCGLVAFSVFNSIAFWATIMQPKSVGDWVQVVLRGSVIPVFFLLAGFLTSVREDVGEILSAAADELTRTMVKASTRQWKGRVRKARKRGANLAESVAQLLEMQEIGGKPVSARIRLMDAAIRAAEAGHAGLSADGSRPDPRGPGGPHGGKRPSAGTSSTAATSSTVATSSTASEATGAPTLRLVDMTGAADGPAPRTGRPRADAGRSRDETTAVWRADLRRARAILKRKPDLGPRGLARELSKGRDKPCSPSRADRLYLAIMGDRPASASASSASEDTADVAAAAAN